MFPAAPIFDPGQAHPKLSRAKRRRGPTDVESSGESHRPREPSEHAFDDVKHRLLSMFTSGGPLLTGNQQRVARDRDLHVRRVDADKVDDHFKTLRRLQHVDRDLAFRSMRRCLVPHQLLE